MVDVIFVYIDWFINQGVALGIVLKLLFFKVPFIMVLFSPMAVLFATMLVFIRAAKDSEMVVFRTSGVNLLKILKPVLISGVLLSLFVVVVNEQVVPYSNHASETIIRKMILKNPLPQLQENVFFNAVANRYFYIKTLDPKNKKFEGIMIYELSLTGYPKIVTARRGYYQDGRWYLSEGLLHYFDEKGRLVCEVSFERLTLDFNRDFSDFFTNVKSTLEMNSEEIKKQIVTFEKSGVATRYLKVDYFVKKAAPFTNLVFILVGVALSVNFVRSQRDFWGMVVAVAIAVLSCGFFFFNMAAFRALGRGGVVVPVLAGWAPNLIFGMVAAIFILKESFSR